jgi:hypothetical protein
MEDMPRNGIVSAGCFVSRGCDALLFWALWTLSLELRVLKMIERQ